MTSNISLLSAYSNILYTSNYISNTSNQIINYTKSLTLSGGNYASSSLWNSNNQYISYSNVNIYSNMIKINNPIVNSHINYDFSEDPISQTTLINKGYGTNMNGTITNASVSQVSTLYPTFDNHSNNLMVWYKFDDNTTNMLLDSSGYSYTLTNNSCTFNSSSKIRGNGSVSFTGSSSLVKTSPSTNYFHPDAFTFSCWIYKPSSTNYSVIACSRNLQASGWVFYANSDVIELWNCYGSDYSYISTGLNIANKWVHLTWCNSGASQKLYLNGTLYGTYTLIARVKGNNDLWFGRDEFNAWKMPSGTLYDDVRMYNRELTAYEISRVYSYDIPYPVFDNHTNNLILWYKFDENIYKNDSPHGSIYDLVYSSTTYRRLTTYNNVTGTKCLEVLAESSSSTVVNLSTTGYTSFISNFTNEMTICYWIKITDLTFSKYAYTHVLPFASGTNNRILHTCYATDSYADTIHFYFQFMGSNYTWIEQKYATLGITRTSDGISYDNMYHFAISCKTGNGGFYKVYVNGVERLSTTSVSSSTISFGPAGDLRIMSNQTGASQSPPVYYDDYRIYNKALSVEEVRKVYGYTLSRSTQKPNDLIPYSYYWNGVVTEKSDNAYITIPKAGIDPIITAQKLSIAFWSKYESLTNNEFSVVNLRKDATYSYINVGVSYSQPIVQGGTINVITGNYYIAVFSSTSGTNTITFPQNTVCDILLVGGGGGGGARFGGGGGAGGFVYQTGYTMTAGTYTIKVGNGGAGGVASGGGGNYGAGQGSNGEDSYIKDSNNTNIFTGVGGGGGGKGDTANGSNGGSGGGSAGRFNGTGGSTTQGNTNNGNVGGYAGGSYTGTSVFYGGGGGGAGGAGTNTGNGTVGYGGIGVSNSITGTATYYAAGGGGGCDVNGTTETIATGGSGIGGNGGGTSSFTQATNGATNTGSGGGGSAVTSVTYNVNLVGGSGGSGIVIIRYLVPTNNDDMIVDISNGANNLVYSSIFENVNNVNTWSHYAIVVDYVSSTLSVKLYKNGSLITTGITGGSFNVPSFSFTASGENTIGYIGKDLVRLNDGSPSYLADFRLYDRALTATDVVNVFTKYDGSIIKKDANNDMHIWNSDNAHMYFGTSNTERMRILADGKVGIGTTAPVDDLHIHNSATAQNVEIRLTDGTTGATSTDGSLIRKNTTSQLQLWNLENADVQFGTNNTTRLIIDGSGYVAINTTTSTSYRLRVNGAVGYTSASVESDYRIKKNIIDVNDDSALQKILSLEPKTYNFIDEKDRGSDRIYGFLSQQVKEVIPEAIKLSKNVIPNIYKNCDCSSNIIYLDNTSNLFINDTIYISDTDNTGEKQKYEILEVNDNSIKIDKEINSSNCFVYGKDIDDFHSLDESYIYTLNVCATQELHRRIEAQQNTINILTSNIEAQQNIINNLVNRITTLENA